MRTSSVIVGALAGIAIGLGGVVVADVATEPADAQGGSSQFVTKAEFNAANKSANARASAAINGYKIANNAITKYFIPNNTLIGAKSGPITQQRGTGASGLPGSTIQNGAITNPKLGNEAVNSEKIAPGGVTSGDLANNSVTGEKIDGGAVGQSNLSQTVQDQLQTIYTAAIFVPFGGEPSLTFGKGATAVTRSGLAAGGFDVTFNANVSQCTFTSSIGTPGQPGAVTPVFGGFFTYSTLLGDNTLRIFTLNQAGAPADAPFAVHVVC